MNMNNVCIIIIGVYSMNSSSAREAQVDQWKTFPVGSVITGDNWLPMKIQLITSDCLRWRLSEAQLNSF